MKKLRIKEVSLFFERVEKVLCIFTQFSSKLDRIVPKKVSRLNAAYFGDKCLHKHENSLRGIWREPFFDISLQKFVQNELLGEDVSGPLFLVCYFLSIRKREQNEKGIFCLEGAST